MSRMPHEPEPETPVDIDDLYFEDTEDAFNDLLTRQQRLTHNLLLLNELHDDIVELDSIGAATLQTDRDSKGILITATAHVTRIDGKPRDILEKYNWLQNTITYDRENRWFQMDLLIRLEAGDHTDSDATRPKPKGSR